MAVIRRPQLFLTPPQYAPQLADDYADAEILALLNDGQGRDLAKGNNFSYPAAPPTKILRPQGYSANFDGSDRLITDREITLPTAFTVFAWVRPDLINYNYSRIAETAYSTGFYLGSNSANSTAAKYAWIVKGASLEGCIGGDQVVGRRDFVVGTYGSLTRKLYVNGVQVASASATNPTSPVAKVYIGHNVGGVNFWRGDIDTFGIFFRTFSADEIWALYNQPGRLLKAPPRRVFLTAVPGTSGSVAYTNNDDTAAASGTTTIIGSVAATNAADTASASGTPIIVGSVAAINADDTAIATNVGEITGTVAYTNNNDTVAASGTPTIVGSVDAINANDRAAATGVLNNGIVVESGLTTGITTAVRIKKPGIPANAPAWLRNMFEILTGRRKNKIVVPEARELTFSSTPTKAECEALYAYINDVRSALNDLVTRFDS